MPKSHVITVWAGANQVRVVVTETTFKSMAGTKVVTDYSVEETGEMLIPNPENPREFVGNITGLRVNI